MVVIAPAVAMGAISGITSLIGGASASSKAKAAAKAQDKYNIAKYEYDRKETRREYKYRKKEVQNQRNNNEQELSFREESARRSHQYDLAIRDFEYGNQVRQFNQSEKLYGQQRAFNRDAEAQAQAAEARRFTEITTGMAFEQQDMLIKMMQEEGAVSARGQAGNSAKKSLGSVLAGYGRNQAIMAESLLSAKSDSKLNYRQIGMDRYGADLAAEGRRMLTPLLAPPPPSPLALPRPILMDPRKPKDPPRPVSGAAFAGDSPLSIAGNALTAGLSSYVGSGGTFGR